MTEIGKLLLITGLVLAALGGLMLLGGRLSFLGRLPGDLTWRKGNVTVYFPLVTSLLVSVLLSGLLWLIRR